jgi:hypothetical protein
MGKFILSALLFVSLSFLSGCYQMSGNDDLRTIPVTNNPNIVPGQGARVPSAPI